MLAFIALTFGKVFYLGAAALPCFFFAFSFLALAARFCGLHAMAAGAIPDGMPGERFRVSRPRAIWRSGITFLVGAGVQHFQSLGIPVALTSIAFAIGLLLIPLARKPAGRPCRRRARDELR